MTEAENTIAGAVSAGETGRFYIDPQTQFTDDAVMCQAEAWARLLGNVSPTKLRQYFDDVKRLARMIEVGMPDDQVKVRLRLIRTRAFYDAKRDNKMENVRDMLDKTIMKIINGKEPGKDTLSFALFFESVYGFFHAFKGGK